MPKARAGRLLHRLSIGFMYLSSSDCSPFYCFIGQQQSVKFLRWRVILVVHNIYVLIYYLWDDYIAMWNTFRFIN